VVALVECYGKIKEGGWVEVMPDEPIVGSYLSKIAIADKAIDAASGAFGVRVELQNSQG